MKRITLLQRRDDVGAADFRRHWAGPHAPIISGLPGVVAYAQNHVVRRTASDVDGIVELWFQPPPGGLAAHRSEEQLADEPRFLRGMAAFSLGELPVCLAPATLWVLDGSPTRVAELREIVSPRPDVTVEFAPRETAVAPVTREALPSVPPVPGGVAVARGERDELASVFRELGSRAGWGRTPVLLAEQLVVVGPDGSVGRDGSDRPDGSDRSVGSGGHE